MTIRRLKYGEVDLYRELRLRALKEAPYAFGATYEEASQRASETWVKQANEATEGSERAIFIVEESGLATVYRDADRPTDGDLIQVWIAPELRGGTAAVELMDFACEWAWQNGFDRLRAEVEKENPHALKFYERYGFMKESVNENGDTVLVMEVDSQTRPDQT